MASSPEAPLLKAHTDALRNSLHSAGLVPGPAASLLPAADWRPATRLRVAFGEKRVELGTFFRAGECKPAKPVVRFGFAAPAERNRRFTFLMIDPDAPTPDDPKFAFWRHWVVSGLAPRGTGEEEDDGVAEEAGKDCGTEVTEYLGPGPKDDSKPHRYLFLLYQEPDGMRAPSKEDVGGDEFVQRRSFDAAAFAARHGLALVGLNWMTCAGDGWAEV
ncbi:phosphatidylethanolamine-binding protein [Apiospora marii]|uniref:Phosphatidylethanolamine-binding protein n=1 Tax=Apiospora marii TaxID=335849 RepID=A0ABR1S9H0_9PEZI